MQYIIQYCDKEMDHKAVIKKWDNLKSKNLANLQRNVRNKSFIDFNVKYNAFCFKKIGSI